MTAPAIQPKQQMVVPSTIPNTALLLNPGDTNKLLVSYNLPGELESFLTDFGNSIDRQDAANFSTFSVYVNGSPLTNFTNLTSQIAPSIQVRHYFGDSCPKLGRALLFQVFVSLGAGAPAATTFSVQATIVSVTPGTRPNV